MAENVNGSDLFGSGGHVWRWAEPQRTRKLIGSAGLRGAWHDLVSAGGLPLTIEGLDGRPAVLRAASAASRALADTAMDALESAIETLVAGGGEYAWEDDQGHSGSRLVLLSYRRAGRRLYAQQGGQWICWQMYRAAGIELSGSLT